MNLDLTEEEAEALGTALEGLLGDLSTEIANTDNAFYRAGLSKHRSALREVHRKLSTT